LIVECEPLSDFAKAQANDPIIIRIVIRTPRRSHPDITFLNISARLARVSEGEELKHLLRLYAAARARTLQDGTAFSGSPTSPFP